MYVHQGLKQLGLKMAFVVFLIVRFGHLMCLKLSYMENWYRIHVYTPVFDNFTDKRKATIANNKLFANVEKVNAFDCFCIYK